ncbi:MAG: flagellar basal body rod protein FlgF [Gammaproteobacteria bacterium]|nr:flagellar basal body rod protein FlgF [Gammaproteobacteria bacterium]
MDRMLYVAMTGARQAMLAQSTNAHNLANASTTGFRADLLAADSLQIEGAGLPSRVNALKKSGGFNAEPGPMQNTDRQLDVAIQGSGWLAVQGPDGEEVYTRSGSLQLGPGGVLTNSSGEVVLGDGGPVAIPPFEQLEIGADGSISIVPLGQSADTLATVDRIRLVNPDPDNLYKSTDGKIRTRDGSVPESDAAVKLASGVLEGSNVNAIASMISMLELTRHFELQSKLMETADNNAANAARLMQIS